MANKQYISPIRLFDHCGVAYDGEINQQRIKKQLAAEFDFAKDGFIEQDGFTYNKTDVLEELERPDFVTRLDYHKRIWKNKPILKVLENNYVDLDEIKSAFDEFQNDVAFDEFFSPYFAAPFNHISRTFLSNKGMQQMGKWLWFRDFLQPADTEEGYKSIRIFFEENDRLFKNISKDNYKTFRSKISHWIEPGWPQFFNNLPDDFYQLKNEMIVDLINLTVKIQKLNAKDCRAISNGLIELWYVPENLGETIASNHRVYNGTATSSSPSYWWVIWVAIFILRLISSGGCN